MTKRMLIDATHAEETRVVVLDGNRLEDFDVETSTKRQLKGNIYLAKVVRVEPSLQAAFVEYGGNRHGFLAFSEIHPDYYQIPVADRQRLIEIQAEEARQEEEEEDRAAEAAASGTPAEESAPEAEAAEPQHETDAAATDEPEHHAAQPALIEIATITAPLETPDPVVQPIALEAEAAPVSINDQVVGESPFVVEPPVTAEAEVHGADNMVEIDPTEGVSGPSETEPSVDHEATAEAAEPGEGAEPRHDIEAAEYVEPAGDAMIEQPPPEVVGGESDSAEEARERRIPSRFLRNYKIQEVIKRRQILLVQVVKEERGTKGAALTTYLSLAGRFCVLMPNSPRGGGISRKITSAADRRRLKEITAELQIPQGMGLIVRTAGANRPKPEIRRDCEYLLRLWDDIREHTLKSVAPAQIYEEASLIKRAIRDVYSRDIDEIQVDGEEGWHAAHDFMRMLMPSHAKKVQLWRNGGQPLFAKYQVEAQLDGMLQPIVQLRSGGYLVINQTEALVAIDVNSGRSTRERGIEETALRTNLEAVDEVARQLRLRDLAGLIVIDLIDMESRKHNAMVERRLKEALKNDRARIQVGSISHFGLMEMSRQRLRPSLAETSFIACPHCAGTGHVRSTESAGIHVLRAIEDEGAKRRAAEIIVYVATPVALYILNHKRERLGEIEARYGMRVACLGDDTQMSAQFRIERVRAQVVSETPVSITQEVPPPALAAAEPDLDDEEVVVEEDEEDEAAEASEAAPGEGTETAEEAERRRRRRRRRRRGGRRDEAELAPATPPAIPEAAAEAPVSEAEATETHIEGVPEHAEAGTDDDQRARRRGRRGGRRRRHDGADGVMPSVAEPGADQPDLPPVYIGPTPANPFGGHTFDIFDVMERAEENAAAMEPSRPVTAPPAIQSDTPPPITDSEPFAIQGDMTLAAAEDVPNTPSPATRGRVGEGEPQAAPPLMFDPEPEPEPDPDPVLAAEPEPAPAAESEPEPEPPLAANDAASEPAIKPIIIGAEETQVVEKKRGWWRR